MTPILIFRVKYCYCYREETKLDSSGYSTSRGHLCYFFFSSSPFFSTFSNNLLPRIYLECQTKRLSTISIFFFYVEQEFSSALRPAALGIISEPALIPVTFRVRLYGVFFFFFYPTLIPSSLGNIFHSRKKKAFQKKRKKKSMPRS